MAVVGNSASLERAQQILGIPTDIHLEHDRAALDYRRVFVSRSEIVGKRIGDLNLQETLGATITRLRRGDVDIVPGFETRLEFGDRVRVLTAPDNFPVISRFFGDSIRGTAETDFASVGLGMAAGVMLGLIPIPLPGGATIRLGLAGGPLIAGLVWAVCSAPDPSRGPSRSVPTLRCAKSAWCYFKRESAPAPATAFCKPPAAAECT